MRKGWYLFFVVGVGPLGASVVVTSNSLIFHSFHTTVALFLNLSPLLTAWCIRGDYHSFHATYPELLVGIEYDRPDTMRGLLLPAVAFYIFWWVPYAAWLLLYGPSRPARGDGTLYQMFESVVVKALPFAMGTDLLVHRPRLAACIYLVSHFIGVLLCYGVSILCYFSYNFFTAYLVAMVLSAVWQGSGRYNYYLLDVYEKKVAYALEKGSVVRNSMAMI